MMAICEIDDPSERYEASERFNAPPSLFDQLDYVPLLSTVTGVARIIFGTLQAVLGIVALPFELLGRILTHGNRNFVLIQGAVNILRGYVATHPFIGNIALYLYDHSNLFIKN